VGGADVKRIPFGIDANGIYMNSDVYIKGTMRVDAGGSTLRDGLRGSLNIGISGSAWSDALARNAIYSALGRGPSAPNNGHLVIGDAITITQGTSSVTKYWNGGSWSATGVVINGDMIVDGGLAASKINTNGLTIRDQSGNVILGSGVNLGVSYINGLGQLATKNSVTSGEVTGLGALATQNAVKLGHNVTFPDGTVINSADLVSKLSKINSGNISTFMDGAAITNAYIGNAAIKNANIDDLAVTTLKIGDKQVTVPDYTSEASHDVTLVYNLEGAPGASYSVFILATLVQSYTATMTLTVDGVSRISEIPQGGALATKGIVVNLITGLHTIRLYSADARNSNGTSIFVLATKK